ncbi:MAG: tRNA (adenosine(37)-N6)-threonylcarbamoyltransferase complex transferase subunit TsaD [Nitrospirae bacterium]|nr:tRNA (adenosine(37)-N6)-threonylcarbamoyltransferase complex transferase subunit TsaD [Nitrospirota bacterium]
MALVIGIETSCDETAASVVEDGKRVLSNIVSSQTEIHSKYGGVVPELACRRHTEIISPIVSEAIDKAWVKLADVNAIAATSGPGLIGALIVGVSFAKSLAYSINIPLIAVNHLEAHIFSIGLEQEVFFPFISVLVSGGHTNLYLVKDYGSYEILGRTYDDAAGEAFDKVAKLLNLGYPGGPIIDKLAKEGNPNAFNFPRALKDSFDFSFSGLKTAVMEYVKGMKVAGLEEKINLSDVAASFQQAVVDVLVSKAISSARKNGSRHIVVAGGVAANSQLRRELKEKAAKEGIEVHIPSPVYCTDNAAMIAGIGYHKLIMGKVADLDLNPMADLPLANWDS